MINRFARRKLHDQEMEGRVIPKEILERLNVQKEIIEEIYGIIGHDHSLGERHFTFRSFMTQIGRSVLKKKEFEKIEEDSRRSLEGYLRQSLEDHCQKHFILSNR